MTACQHGEASKDCPLCKLAEQFPAFQDAFPDARQRTKAVRTQPSPGRVRLPCISLGEETGETVQCKSCGGSVRIKLFSCLQHSECTAAKPVTKENGRPVACCRHCSEYVPDQSAVRTELAAPAPQRKPRKTPTVLFASQYLEFDGAPIILANLIPHLRGIKPILYSPVEGPLRDRHERAGTPVTLELNLDGVDLVVANTIASAPAVDAAKAKGIPAIWLIHESDPGMVGNRPDVERLIGYPDAVIFPSQATAKEYEGLPKHNGMVIHSVIPPIPAVPTKSHSHKNNFVVLTFGRDEDRKNQVILRQAVNLCQNVVLKAVHDDPDPFRHFADADVYVCSSKLEAFPLSIQEAKAHGVPVISADTFGCKEIIRDGIDGLLYEPSDVIALKERIERLQFDARLRSDLSGPLTHLPSFGESVADYERAIHRSCGLPVGDLPLHVVWHVASIGPWWKDIAAEQIGQLAACGLYRVTLTHVGDPKNAAWLIEESQRAKIELEIAWDSPELRLYERPALRLIRRLSRSSDKPLLYLHGKGVTHHPQAEPLYHDWRRLMMRELVAPWRTHLRDLDSYDLIGVNWWTSTPHFSGNFWMARADWIRRLPEIDAAYKDRYSCEIWIGKAEKPVWKSLVCRDQRFWDAAEGTAELNRAMALHI